MPSDFSLSSTCIVIWLEVERTGETYKPTFVYLGVCMFFYLGNQVFQDFFIAGVSLLMCSYLQDAVRYWQESLGPDFLQL